VRRFVHPYDKEYHALFFSDDCNFMLETLENDRIFLYKWVNNKWDLIRRMHQFPAAIEKYSLG